ncbi:MAG: Flp family type IVb pilin [Pseudolabrys sp.]|jgi:Flp pilus assembly pilin Flp
MPILQARHCKFFRPAFFKDQSGATAIEYGLICSAIGIIILAAVKTTGQQLLAKLTFLLNLLG